MNSTSFATSFVLILLCLPANSAQQLPAGAGLKYAMDYYLHYVVAGKPCPATIGINARNKSAILKLALSDLEIATRTNSDLNTFAVYFAAANYNENRCHSALEGLPPSLVNRLMRKVKYYRPSGAQTNCPVLKKTKKLTYELYLEAIIANLMWDTLSNYC